jgi:hypothetical protein
VATGDLLVVPYRSELFVNTRTIAILALVIAVVLLVIILV